MTSPHYTADPNEADAGGVHKNSGVNNKAAFLMTDGGTFNGRTVTGSTSPRSHASTTRPDHHAHIGERLRGSRQRAPAGLQQPRRLVGITAGDCVEVTRCSGGRRDEHRPRRRHERPRRRSAGAARCRATCSSTTSRTPAAGTGLLAVGLVLPAERNPTASTPRTRPAAHQNLLGLRPADYRRLLDLDEQQRGDPRRAHTYLRFNHAYGFEDDAGHAYDGGVLEYSTNSGASWSDLGPLLTDGGYNGTITTSFDNPLEGPQRLRAGEQRLQSRAVRNLSSLAGQSVRIRFRIGTDFIADDYGWFIDDIRIYTCGPMLAPTAATQAASNVTTSGATLNGMVDPNGTATSYQFEFGPTAAYGSFAPAGPASVGAGSDPIAVTQTIGGLAAATTYHYRVVAVRGATRVNGADQTFTTTSPPPPPVLPPGCTIAGTAGNDVLVGTAGADVICGLGGSDTIRGLGGSDTLKGAGGNDRLIGGAGADTLVGGAGADTLIGGARADTLLGGSGNDTLAGSNGRDVLKGQGGADLLFARDGVRDTVNGGLGRDRARLDRGLDRRVSVERLL